MSISAPSSHSHKSSTLTLKLLVLFVSIIIGLFSVFPNTAQAAGESYQWVGTTNDRAILGTGGAFVEEVAFEYDGVHDGKQWYRPSGSLEIRVQCGNNEQTTSTLQTTTQSPRIERDPDAPNATRLVVSGHRSPCGRGSTGGYLLTTGPMSVVSVIDEKAACEAAGRVWTDNRCSITGNPQTDEPEEEERPITCETSPDVTPALRFVACPALEATTSSIWLLDDLVTNMLNYDIRSLEDSAARDAWRSFQIIAYSLVFIAGLMIVIGQAAGVQFLDAYTIKKALPRLIVAVIFIALSWEVLLFFVAFMNQLGLWTQDLILEPFGSSLKDMNAEAAWISGALEGGIVAGAATGTIGVIIYMATIGWAGVGLILLSWLIGILIVFAVIAIRTIVITLGIVLAPLAIASMILPATQNLWELWRKAFLTASTVFPLIMALLAMGKVAGDIMGWPLLPLLYIAPYFLIPAVFKLAGGLIGRIAGMVNDPSRGVFDRMRNARGEMYGRNKQEAIEGRTGLGASKIGGFHRRASLMRQGGFSATKAGRGRYAEATRLLGQQTAANEIEKGNAQREQDDTSIMIAAERGMTADKFVKRYMAVEGKSEQEARTALASVEGNFGARIGTNANRNIATHLANMSSTAIDPDSKYGKQLAKEGVISADADYGTQVQQMLAHVNGNAIADGLTTAGDLVGASKSNKGRSDISGPSGGGMYGYYTQAARLASEGKKVSADMARKQNLSARESNMSGASFFGNTRGLKSAAPIMREELDLAMEGWNNLSATATNQEIQAAWANLMQKTANVANDYDSASRASPEAGQIYAESVLAPQVKIKVHNFTNGQGVPQNLGSIASMVNGPQGQGSDARVLVDAARDDPTVRLYRREYGGNNAATTAAAQDALRQQAGEQSGPPGGP